MQDDPERGECFQHKMILKRRQPGEGTLRVNANHHGACSTSHAGRDARIRGLQRQPQLYRRRAQGDLRSCRMHLAGARVLAASEEKQRRRAALFGQDQRAQLGADHAADPALPPKRGRPARGTPPASLSAPLHTGRYRPVGHGRCGPRRAFGSGTAAHPMARIPRLRQGRLPTIGLPLGLAHLQPAAHRGLSTTPRPSHPDALPRGGHWRAAAAQPVRPARLSAGRHGASRRHRHAPRAVPHQCRRYGDAMAGGGLLPDDLGSAFAARAGGHPAPVPLPHPRLSLRQRLGVSQPSGGQAAAQAADRRVHQVAGASHDRQRPGGGQKRRGRAQAHRPRADRGRARRGVPALLHGLVQPLFELSPPLRVCHRGGERARQAPAPLSARGLPHALRKAGLTRRVGAALEAGHHGRFSRATDAADERYRMRPEHAATQEKAAGPVPLPLVNPRTTGRGLAAPDSAGMGGGGGSSTNAVDQGHTRLRFPPPSNTLRKEIHTQRWPLARPTPFQDHSWIGKC